ncbi:DUF997 family protein [Virgibacillus oceani]
MKQDNTHWEEDPRFKQCNREFFATLLLFLFNVIIVLGGASLLGHGAVGENMQMVFGLPAWFFWGGIVATAVFCLASIIMVRTFFKDMSLKADDHRYEE